MSNIFMMKIKLIIVILMPYFLYAQDISIEHLPKTVNTFGSELNFVRTDEKTAFYTSSSNGEDYQTQVYKINYHDNKWSKSSIFHLDNNFSTANIQPLLNGNYYFSSCKDNTSCKIGVKNTRRKEIKILEEPINISNTTNTQPHVAKQNEQKVLFFVSDRPGGYGGMDIWLSVIDKKGNYGNPINLGNKINTNSDEITPFYNTEDNNLYFSSNKPQGQGGFDIYRAEGLLNIWKESENVAELNTSKDENYLNFYTKSKGYFCSNREPACFDTEDFCCTDVFSFEYLDFQQKNDSIEQKIISQLPLNLYFHNDEPDCCTMDTVTDQTYTQSYISYFKLQNKYMQENKGEDIVIFFEDSLKGNFNKLEQVLNLLEEILSTGDKVEIQIRGFTSPLHSTAYNVNLSKRRINSFMNFLDKFENGNILQYLTNNQLIITFLPFGESKSSDSVSDNRNDKRKSIYSLPAMYSRKIQLLNVNFQQ